ncbi:hypothetical protein [Desulfocurvibacter africanus]|uniref:Uncharacterized protein n=1 Tax=Desulfocurvibacter africanus subsp. africanus str. Walvis Bay TaxID=690850 RepID=F3Z2M8_DESAF|nr:hypothetical protein [Desulfocurvibacter africanus]EGJ51361.1 hypothetical protein Desaf_3063 [Desulfocurvibacter africanus subsp. africanus str. Walvis Bay]
MDTHYLAWNGLSLTRPAGWDLAALGRQRLQLARNGKPMLDVRWNRIRGRFSFDAHLRKLEKAHDKKHGGFSVTDDHKRWDLGPDMAARSFVWGDSGKGGRGALLHHSASSTAILVQSSGPAEQAEAVLSSLHCHWADPLVPWAVYDLRAQTPGCFHLEEYALQPGRYRLALRSSRQRLVLHRLAPADILLIGRSLVMWSREHFEAAIRRCHLMMEETGDVDAVTWRRPLPPGRLASATALLLNRPVHAYIRVWRPASHNRLLCVEMQGATPLDKDMIKQVVNSYATV